MNRLFPYLYFFISMYCFVNVYFSVIMHEYQLTVFTLFLAIVHFTLFMIFNKMPKKSKLRLVKKLHS
jgi:hypothetical protein